MHARVQHLLETAYASNKLIAAIDHGPAALVRVRNCKLGDPGEGLPILADKQARPGCPAAHRFSMH
jgi:putative intracellular protease/amidase